MSSATILTCPLSDCQETFTRLGSRDRHLKKQHGMTFLCSAEGCNHRATGRRDMQSHIRECHKTASDRKPRKQRQKNKKNEPQPGDSASMGATPSATETSNLTLRSFEDLPNPTHNNENSNSISPQNENQDYAQLPTSFQNAMPTYPYYPPQTFSMSEYAPQSYDTSMAFESRIPGGALDSFDHVQEDYEEPGNLWIAQKD